MTPQSKERTLESQKTSRQQKRRHIQTANTRAPGAYPPTSIEDPENRSVNTTAKTEGKAQIQASPMSPTIAPMKPAGRPPSQPLKNTPKHARPERNHSAAQTNEQTVNETS